MIMHELLFLNKAHFCEKAQHDYNYSIKKKHFAHLMFFEDSNFCKRVVLGALYYLFGGTETTLPRGNMLQSWKTKLNLSL